MRVAVVCGRIGDLDLVAAGTALARGIAAHAQVALAPVAAGGPDLAVAVAALTAGEARTHGRGWLVRWPGTVLIGFTQAPVPEWAPAASTAEVGEWIASGIGAAGRVVLDLTGITAHDGGAGLLGVAGHLLARRELVGLVRTDELELSATGIGGGLARRAFAARLDVAELLAADAERANWAASLGVGLATAPGLDRGGPVVQAVAAWADEAERPCVLFTTGAGLARRELRTLGLEAAHLLPPGPPTPEGLTATAARIASGWVPGPETA